MKPLAQPPRLAPTTLTPYFYHYHLSLGFKIMADFKVKFNCFLKALFFPQVSSQ